MLCSFIKGVSGGCVVHINKWCYPQSALTHNLGPTSRSKSHEEKAGLIGIKGNFDRSHPSHGALKWKERKAVSAQVVNYCVDDKPKNYATHFIHELLLGRSGCSSPFTTESEFNP